MFPLRLPEGMAHGLDFEPLATGRAAHRPDDGLGLDSLQACEVCNSVHQDHETTDTGGIVTWCANCGHAAAERE